MASLIPWRERRELDRFRSEMERLFDRFFDWRPFHRFTQAGEWVPSMDVSETAKDIIIKAEVPGMDARDIEVSLNGRALTIRGERKSEHEEEGEDFHKVERSYGKFSRTFELPADVDTGKVRAIYRRGVLKLNLPKAKEQSTRKIEVKAV